MSKKIVMATLVALALAAPAMAFDVQIKGDLNNRFYYTDQADVTTLNSLSSEGRRYVNVPLTTNPGLTNETGSDDSQVSGEIKYRLWFNATDDDKKVKGVIGFEMGGGRYGDSNIDFGGDAKGFLEVMHAYTSFELPFDPASHLTLGLQPVGLNKWVWSDNAGGIKYSSKRGALGYDLAWFRNEFTAGGSTEARNVYALDVKYAGENMPKLNVFGIYSHDDQATVYTAHAASAALNTATADKDTQYWLGAAIDGQAGPLFYGATVVYEGGELEGLAGQDYDHKGLLGNIQGVYKLDKTRLTLGYLYVSGDDDVNDDDLDNYGNIDAYTGQIGSVVIFDSYADDNTASSSPYLQDKGYNGIYLHVDQDLSDKTSVGASYLWHNTAEDLTASKDDDLGHELVVRASTKITKNLTAGIKVGYLIGGDAWEELGTATDDGDDMLVTDASIRLKF